MQPKVVIALTAMVAALAAIVAAFWPRTEPAGSELPHSPPTTFVEPVDATPQPTVMEPIAAPPANAPAAVESVATKPPPGKAPALNKAERLAQIRETYRALAAGDPTTALRAARQITDETERETALLALVTEWKRGELDPPRQRAWAIASFGLEAGLGFELARNPELAVLWANEMTAGESRAAVLQHTALAMLDADPAAAFALSEQFAAEERRGFLDSVFAGWAGKDTDAALQWAEQLSDATERTAAIQAIRTVAPVGIGTAINMENGYPVIRQLMPCTPAELSGQLRPGGRILALAQGDNVFVDARGLALQDVVQMIRGAPGSVVQLQVLPADATPNFVPQTVSIVRGQIKFKQ
jgi:hypothetical protein